jgi:hypothetical protein
MRWQLTHPNRNVDLDIYLFRAGQMVAASTGGGTNELIELRTPQDGVYTLFVHGWETGAQPRTSYRLRSWDVPVRADDTLRVVRAPGEAVIGRTGRIQVAWRGLPAGGPARFGAVTHHRAGNVLGLTVVQVTPGR